MDAVVSPSISTTNPPDLRILSLIPDSEFWDECRYSAPEEGVSFMGPWLSGRNRENSGSENRLLFSVRYGDELLVLSLLPKASLTALEIGESQRRTNQMGTPPWERPGRFSTLLCRGAEMGKKAPQKEMQLKLMKAQLLK